MMKLPNIRTQNHLSHQAYVLDLNHEQMKYLNSLLPFGYSFQPVPRNKGKKKSSFKHPSMEKNGFKDEKACQKQENPGCEKIEKSNSEMEKTPRQNENIKGQQSNSGEKLKGLTLENMIYEQLKTHRFSDLFLSKPDNPNQQIKMNLDQIQKNITTNKYINQFHLFQIDLSSMIEQGYRIYGKNKKLVAKVKMFEKHSNKLLDLCKADKIQSQQETESVQNRKITLLQKKEVLKNLKKLTNQNLETLKKLILGKKYKLVRLFDINLDELSTQKFLKVQRFIRLKVVQQLQNAKINKKTEENRNRSKDTNSYQSQSSFGLSDFSED